MIITGLTIENFKCFGTDNNYIEDLSNINIFIGKNNSGKSTILQIIDLIFCFPEYKKQVDFSDINLLIHNLEKDVRPNVRIEVKLNKEELRVLGFEDKVQIVNLNLIPYQINLINELIDKIFLVKIDLFKVIQQPNSYYDYNIIGTFSNSEIENVIKQSLNQKKDIFNNLFKSKFSKFIPAIRDIKKEKRQEKKINNYIPNGEKITLTFYDFINRIGHDSKIIKEDLKNSINDVLAFFKFNTFNVKESEGIFEIYIETEKKEELPLSNFGTGLVDLIIFLVNFTINIKHFSFICIEEPENNFHPSLQRKFYEYLKRIANEKNIQIFISTHSTYFLNATEIGNVYRTYLENDQANIVKCDKNLTNFKDLIKIIGVENTQFLFADKIILVEGLSDKLIYSHFARKFDLDMEGNNILFLDVGSKYNFKKYIDLLESFKIITYIITDCDFLNRGISSIQDTKRFDEEFNKKLNMLLGSLQKEINREMKTTSLKSKDYIDFNKIFEGNKEKYYKYQELSKKVVEGKSSKEDTKLLEELKFFIELEEKSKKSKVIGRINPPIKEDMINLLLEKNIFILRKGELEDYYPDITGRDKNTKAINVITTYDLQKIKEIGKLQQSIKTRNNTFNNEFQLILETIYYDKRNLI